MRTPPQALADQANRRQWVAWGRPDAPKMPINPHTGGNAMPNNPQTWGTLPEALDAVNRYHLKGVGLVTGQGLGAIDLDHVIGPDGQLHPDAAQIMETMDSYTELSMSGTGLHILFEIDAAAAPYDRKRQKLSDGAEIELYTESHYIALTGNVYKAPKAIEYRAAQADAIYKRYLYRPEPPQAAPAPAPRETYIRTEADSAIIDKMLSNSPKAAKLWQGDYSQIINGRTGKPDHSAADQALINILAYYTDTDPNRAATIERLFKQSALYRPEKWEQHIGGGRLYGQTTIDKAIAQCPLWTPPSKRQTEHGPLAWDAVIDDGDGTPQTNKAPLDSSAPKGGNTVDTQKITPEWSKGNWGDQDQQQEDTTTARREALPTPAPVTEQTAQAPGQAAPNEAKAANIFTGPQTIDLFLKKVRSDAYRPLQTGIPAIDRVMGGGVYRQDVILLAAGPGMGKTVLAAQICESLASTQHTPVIYLNLEMSREQLIARALARTAYLQLDAKTINHTDILQGYAWDSKTIEARDPNDFRRTCKRPLEDVVMEAAGIYREAIAPYMVYDPWGDRATDIDEIMAHIEQEAERETRDQPEGPKRGPIICVDYLQLITGTTGQGNYRRPADPVETIRRAMDAFIGYSIKWDTTVIVLTATNRDAIKAGDAGLTSGRDTSNIEFSACVHMGIGYDDNDSMKAKLEEYNNAKKTHLPEAQIIDKLSAYRRELNNRKLTVNKTRHGEPGLAARLMFIGGAALFVPVTTMYEDPQADQAPEAAEPEQPTQQPATSRSRQRKKKGAQPTEDTPQHTDEDAPPVKQPIGYDPAAHPFQGLTIDVVKANYTPPEPPAPKVKTEEDAPPIR